ncbi:MAG: hypothetical protein NVS4B13_12230 [Candidatus Elarobacter sp.]
MTTAGEKIAGISGGIARTFARFAGLGDEEVARILAGLRRQEQPNSYAQPKTYA